MERCRVGESWLLGWGHQEGGEALLGVQSALTSMNTSLVTENVPPLSLPLKLSAHLLVAFGHRPYLLLSRPYLRLDSACLFSQRLFFLHPIPMSLHGLTGGQLLHPLVGFAYSPKAQAGLQGGPCQRGILEWVVVISLVWISQFGEFGESRIKASDESRVIQH